MKKDIDKPLRIGILSYRSNPHSGGQGVYLRHLARALKDLGHYVEVISGPPTPLLDPDIPFVELPSLDLYNPEDLFRTPGLHELKDPVNLIEWIGVSTMGFPEPCTFGLRSYLYLRNKLDQFDVIHDNQSLSYGLWALKKIIPTVATIHHPITRDQMIAVKSEKVAWKKMQQLRWFSFLGMQKRVARSLSRIITVSECSKDDISHDFRVPEDRFRVVPNGIDIELFRPGLRMRREMHRVIVTNSSDVPLKGLHYLLRAVALINSMKKRIHLVVIGKPKEGGEIEKLVRELGIGNLITFTGRISDEEFFAHYAKASVAVVPSVYEGFGLPAGEAMACAVPVISTTGGALPEVVGDAGILVPPGDPGAIADALVTLFDNPEYAEEIGQKGFNRVMEHFTWEKAAQRTVDVYKEVFCSFHNQAIGIK